MTNIHPIALTSILVILLASLGYTGYQFVGTSQKDISKLYICEDTKLMTDNILKYNCTSGWLKLSDLQEKKSNISKQDNNRSMEICSIDGCVKQ
jgi:hypothetical protein